MFILAFGSVCYANGGYIVKFTDDTVMLFENDYIPLIPEIGLYITNDIPEGASYEYVEQNLPVELYDTYDYSYVLNNFETSMTNISSMWEIGTYGSGIKIGIIDSGCNKHVGISYTQGHNYIDNSSDCTDNINHGTAVSGVAAALYGRSPVIGAAHKAEIIPLKFIDKDASGNTVGGTVAHMILAIKDSVDTYDCDIINISAGVDVDINALSDAIDYAVNNGVIVVASVGNNYDSRYNYPASYDNVIGVGSINSSYEHSDFSNYNDSVFVMAPGENVELLYNETDTRISSGTSFSSPYVAGIIACMLDIDPSLNLDEVKNIIANTTLDLGSDGYDFYYGYGLIDAAAIADRLIQDKDYYISDLDICSEDGFYEKRIKRREGMPAPIGIWSAYSEGKVYNLLFDDMEFIDNVCVMRYKKPENTDIKCFIWNSFTKMMPVGD